MKISRHTMSVGLAGIFAVSLLTVHASTKETHDALVTAEIPRPGQIWVYDFAATDSDVPADSALADTASTDDASQTAEHIALGRKLGVELATELVQQINALGMSAQKAGAETKPQLNDLVIRGSLVSFTVGDKAKRIGIGFRSGASEMQVAIEGFQITATGSRKLGSGTTDSGGGKAPGAIVGAGVLIATHNPLGLIVSTGLKVHKERDGSSTVKGRTKKTVKEISDQLKERFEQQGWIK